MSNAVTVESAKQKIDSDYYFAKIREWASDRNLIDGSTPHAQMVKLMEEIGELASGIAKGNSDVIFDSIGDAIVVLTILAEQCSKKFNDTANIEDCLQIAYLEIKDRKGKMVDGVFIKDI